MRKGRDGGENKKKKNTSLAAPGALANRLQHLPANFIQKGPCGPEIGQTIRTSKFQKNLEKYQPSGAGGTRSPLEERNNPNWKSYLLSKPEKEFHVMEEMYAASQMRMSAEKTTFLGRHD